MRERTLLCAATSIEAKACQKGIEAAGHRLGRKDSRFEILQTGMGLRQAELKLKARLSDLSLDKPSQVISTGFAGSATRELSIGSWVFAESVELQKPSSGAVHMTVGAPATLTFSNRSHRPRAVRLITLAEALIQSPEPADSVMTSGAKPSLPLTVDMESFAWAELCRQHGIPFSVLRLISDNPDAPLPASIARFTQFALAPSYSDKLKHLTQGMSQALREPAKLGRFVARGTKLPKLLEDGWKEFASHE